MSDLRAQFDQIRARALAYPEAYEESPWGELAIKVRKKVFVFLGRPGDKLSLSLKLPESGPRALELPQATPTGYGLGRHGWVSFGFEEASGVPFDDLLEWLEESYRVVAPKRLMRQLAEGPASPRPSPAAPISQRILLVGDDPLRLSRAQQALAARGADVATVSLAGALDAAGAGAPDVVIVDLSRNATDAIALVPDVGLLLHGQLVVAGIRDAKMERALAELHGVAWSSREPPGDPDFVEILAGKLA